MLAEALRFNEVIQWKGVFRITREEQIQRVLLGVDNRLEMVCSIVQTLVSSPPFTIPNKSRSSQGVFAIHPFTMNAGRSLFTENKEQQSRSSQGVLALHPFTMNTSRSLLTENKEQQSRSSQGVLAIHPFTMNTSRSLLTENKEQPVAVLRPQSMGPFAANSRH